MNPLLTTDIFITICDGIQTCRELLQFELISKLHKFIIRNNNFSHVPINIYSDDVCYYVLANYKFKNLVIHTKCNPNIFIDTIKYCHTLDLISTNITDDGVIKLKKCH